MSVGYRSTPRVAAELDFKWTRSFSSVRPEMETLETILLDPNFKVYLLTGRLQPFVGVGLGYYSVELGDFELRWTPAQAEAPKVRAEEFPGA